MRFNYRNINLFLMLLLLVATAVLVVISPLLAFLISMKAGEITFIHSMVAIGVIIIASVVVDIIESNNQMKR
jgi:pilus assembly protein TadC